MEQQPPQEKQDADTSRDASHPKHDLGHKRLFSHRRMAADLLRLLAEFQSRVDPRMAERMLEYAAMLRRDLAREGKVRGPDGGQPPLLPLVVYNGRRPWTGGRRACRRNWRPYSRGSSTCCWRCGASTRMP